MRRRTLLFGALATPGIARAQNDFPNRSIRLVIPWPPGASADAFLRVIAEQTGKRLGQSMVPDNKPGANASLSAVALKDAKPDGYTLGQIHTGTFRILFVCLVDQGDRLYPKVSPKLRVCCDFSMHHNFLLTIQPHHRIGDRIGAKV